MTVTATFQATLTAHGTTPFLIVPAATATALNLHGRVTVDGTLNGVPFERRSIHPWDERFFVEIPQRLCRQARATVGDLVDVTVHLVADSLPSELAERLAADLTAHAAWAALTSSRQRQLANQIADARLHATRIRRADACIRSLTNQSTSSCRSAAAPDAKPAP